MRLYSTQSWFRTIKLRDLNGRLLNSYLIFIHIMLFNDGDEEKFAVGLRRWTLQDQFLNIHRVKSHFHWLFQLVWVSFQARDARRINIFEGDSLVIAISRLFDTIFVVASAFYFKIGLSEVSFRRPFYRGRRIGKSRNPIHAILPSSLICETVRRVWVRSAPILHRAFRFISERCVQHVALIFLKC